MVTGGRGRGGSLCILEHTLQLPYNEANLKEKIDFSNKNLKE
jgi:hypothetical protein